MSHLKLVPKPAFQIEPMVNKSLQLYTGQAYEIDGAAMARLVEVDGVIGDYHISPTSGSPLPLSVSSGQSATCFLWDEGLEPKRLAGMLINNGSTNPLSDYQLRSNHLQLNDTQLEGPELISDGETTTLCLTPSFACNFITDQQAASLGVIHLVQSHRFALLEDGTQYPLLESGDSPVLYLTPGDEAVVKSLASLQQAGHKQSYNYRCPISQVIPGEIDGQAVASLTVLEQYTSYFMQRPAPLVGDTTIWVPAYAPISWGWSIRVERRFDGEWGIQRRKLILPTIGHDGLQLPVWQNNSLACSPTFQKVTL